MKLFLFCCLITITSFACSNDAESTTNSQEVKPNLCHCKNDYLRLIEMENSGKTIEKRQYFFSDWCAKYYSTEQLMNAECGIQSYDPNYKAKD